MKEYRKQFPLTRQMIYLDAATSVPLPAFVVEAVTSFYKDLSEKGEEDRQVLEERTEVVCRLFADLINAASEEVTMIRNTTEGLNIAANGLPLQPGDNVIISDLEHLNNVYPWLNVHERKGIEVRILRSREGRLSLDDLSSLVNDRTRVLSLSFVTLAGLKIDLKPFGQYCREHNIYFIVDGIQGVGRTILDVKESLIDIMACGGHKGLMSGRGIGCLFVDNRILKDIRVTYAGPPIEFRHDPVDLVFKQSAGAKKFNAGSANYSGICALHASLTFLNKVGVKSIEDFDLELGKLLVEGLQKIEGVKVLVPWKPEESCGVVSFSTSDNTKVAKGLAKHKIKVSLRGNGIRVSPHFYNTKEEIISTVEVVGELLST
jgi:cysteine desulfurase / selenocysteine lyase